MDQAGAAAAQLVADFKIGAPARYPILVISYELYRRGVGGSGWHRIAWAERYYYSKNIHAWDWRQRKVHRGMVLARSHERVY